MRHFSLLPILLLSLVGLLISCVVFQPVEAITVDEYASLLSFRSSTSLSSYWLGAEPCLWYGITCTNSVGHIYTSISDDSCGYYNASNNCIHQDYHITEIRLSENPPAKFTGTLPLSAISGFHWLRLVEIYNHDFRGPLPPFTSHPELYHVYIMNTQFSGNIPRFGPRNTSIQYSYYAKIWLIQNQFTGISEEAQQPGNAEGFTSIDLSLNKFTSSYFTFLPTTVETFICDRCGWEGDLTSLTPQRVTSLKYVLLTGYYDDSGMKASLSGSIAPLFHPTASRLEIVILDSNKFSSAMENNTAIPAPALKQFKILYNNFKYPPNVTQATNLREYSLDSNPLTINIDTFIQTLPLNNPAGHNLQTLSCSRCGLTGAMPTLSPNMVASLTSVFLPGNSITGSYASFFHPNASKLKWLDISYNRFDIQVPEIPPSPITTLKLDNNNIPGRGPIIQGSSLTQFTISSNHLSSFPNISTHLQLVNTNFLYYLLPNPYNTTTTSFFTSMPAKGVRSLKCRECGLTGSIPSLSPEFLANLTEIDLSSNNINGSIAPIFHPTASRLITLKLNNNKLDQPLPSIISAPNLRTFECSNNFIPGASTFFNSSSLMVLDLSHNLISGTLPTIKNNGSRPQVNIDCNWFTPVSDTALTQLQDGWNISSACYDAGVGKNGTNNNINEIDNCKQTCQPQTQTGTGTGTATGTGTGTGTGTQTGTGTGTGTGGKVPTVIPSPPTIRPTSPPIAPPSIVNGAGVVAPGAHPAAAVIASVFVMFTLARVLL